jgi:16S rRNA (uracil1498-N3)-methyltransferase
MKQSGRSYLPQVHPVRTLKELLADPRAFDRTLIAHERPVEGTPGPDLATAASALILVGPEGGFSDAEVAAATAAGCRCWYLGERRLRTETACVVTVAQAILSGLTQR